MMGATYEVDPERAGAGTRGARNDEDPGSTSGLAHHTVSGLESGTEYSFRVRGTGDGSRWTNEASDWSALTVRTAGYAAFREAPALSGECAGVRHPAAQSPIATRTTSDGTTITAKSEIYKRMILSEGHEDRYDYCVQSRFISKAAPGADTMSWSGKLHKTLPSINSSDVSNYQELDHDDFYEFFDEPPAPPTGSVVKKSIGPYSCSEPCQGGAIQTRPTIIHRKYIKVTGMYANGQHDFSTDGGSYTLYTSSNTTIPMKGPDSGPDGQLDHGDLLIFWSNVGLEFAGDIAPEPVQPIIDFLQQLVPGGGQ